MPYCIIEQGLVLKQWRNLHDFVAERTSTNEDDADLWGEMVKGRISQDEWEAVGIYVAFAFQKKEAPRTGFGAAIVPSPLQLEMGIVEEEDIKYL